MAKKISFEFEREIKQLTILEGESIEIILHRYHTSSISLTIEKKDGVCSLKFKDPDVDIFEEIEYKWVDKSNSEEK